MGLTLKPDKRRRASGIRGSRQIIRMRGVLLPQLISSAEAAQSVCNLVERMVLSEGGTLKDRGCIIMATVAGDIHDIGKT